MLSIVLLCCFAFLAGFLDAIVGGGGLVQLPALFIVLHDPLAAKVIEPADLLGTNKLSSIAGTTIATWQYARRVEIPWRTMLPAAMMAFVCSFCGSMLVAHLQPSLLKPLVFVLLLVVAAYTFFKKDFGSLHAPKLSERWQMFLGIVVCGGIGFYDGFFGPGTGSFLIFTFIGLFGFSFLSASASAKVVNFATNLASVLYFGSAQHILFEYAIPMAVCNIAGSLLGSRLALKQGTRFIRLFFLAVVSAIIARFAYDLWRG